MGTPCQLYGGEYETATFWLSFYLYMLFLPRVKVTLVSNRGACVCVRARMCFLKILAVKNSFFMLYVFSWLGFHFSYFRCMQIYLK